MAETKRARRQRWYKALRSGEYKQTDGRLRDGNSFCCLGVACDVFDPELWEGTYYLDNSLSLPDLVVEYFGLSNYDVRVEYHNSSRWVSDLNDKGVAFSEIADLLEKALEKKKS